MAGGEVTIPELASSGSLGGTELLAGVQGGLTVKIIVDQVLAYIQNNIQINQAQVNDLVDDLAGKQPLSDILTAISAITTMGLIDKTGSDTFVTRSIVDSDDINFSINGDGNYEASLIPTAVTPGEYGGEASTIVQTVDSDGRLTACAAVLISIAIAQVFALQDALDTLSADISDLASSKQDAPITVDVTSSTLPMLPNSIYLANSVLPVTLELPASIPKFSTIKIIAKNSGGFVISQNSGQTIKFGNQTTSTGVTGSLSSTSQYDAVELICIEDNTTLAVISSIGNLQLA
jgi:hypothetical protein